MATWDRYKIVNETSFEVRVRTGTVWQPRYYCDDNSFQALPDEVKPYLKKAPVCNFDVTPIVQFLGQSFAWDISESQSPTTTLASFDVAFGSAPGTTDLPGQDWAIDPQSGTVTPTALGTYVFQATVTDQLGVTSQTASVEVRVVENAARVYIGTTTGGVYVLDSGGVPTASNSGLSGDHLKLRAIRLHPATAQNQPANQHVWIATANGLAVSTDGAATWTTIAKADLGTPENASADSPAPVTAGLDQIDISFDPLDERRVYVLRTTSTRTWLYYSDDYGTTWSNEQMSGS